MNFKEFLNERDRWDNGKIDVLQKHLKDVINDDPKGIVLKDAMGVAKRILNGKVDSKKIFDQFLKQSPLQNDEIGNLRKKYY